MTPRPVSRALLASRLSRVECGLAALEGLVISATHEAALPAPLGESLAANELDELRAVVVGWSVRIRARSESLRRGGRVR